MSIGTKAQATKLSKVLAKQLGSNWEPTVWENLGWHYGAKLMTTAPSLDVHIDAAMSGIFVIYVHAPGVDIHYSSYDSSKLLPEAMKQLHEQVARLQGVCDAIEEKTAPRLAA
jgi:hypothetical protein